MPTPREDRLNETFATVELVAAGHFGTRHADQEVRDAADSLLSYLAITFKHEMTRIDVHIPGLGALMREYEKDQEQ